LNISAAKIAKESSSIYSLPAIYSKLDSKIQDPFSNIEDIAKILLEDSGLAVRLLKLANSALFNLPSKVDTVSRAITIIGTNQLQDLALATAVLEKFEGIESSLINMEDFWKHSIAVGIAARVIATYRSEPNVERFYLMGLLHDVGRILMYTQIPQMCEGYIKESRQCERPLYEIETESLGFNHCDIGRLLFEYWNLPELIVDAIGNHHHPFNSTNFKLEASIIHIADLLIHGIQLGNSTSLSIVPPLNEAAWELIDLPTELVPDILGHIESQYIDAIKVLLK
jgi:HD-like signal output (HDOD) protein